MTLSCRAASACAPLKTWLYTSNVTTADEWAHAFLHRLDVHPRHEQERRAGMTEIVKAKLQTGSIEDWFEGMAVDVGLAQPGLVAGATEDQRIRPIRPLREDRLAVFPERVEGEVYRAIVRRCFFCFRLFQSRRPADLLQRPRDRHGATDEMDVLPRQT